MNKWLVGLAILAAASVANAQTVGAGAVAGSASESTSVSGAAAQSKQTQGQAQDQLQAQQQGQRQSANNANLVAPVQAIIVNEAAQPSEVKMISEIHNSGTQTIKAAPSVGVGAGTVINNDLCTVQTSIAGSGIGFGVGFAGGLTDEDCVRRINARQLFNMGYAKAAIALMAKNKDVADALAQAGFTPTGEPLPPPPPPSKVIKGADDVVGEPTKGAATSNAKGAEKTRALVSEPSKPNTPTPSGVPRMKQDSMGNWVKAD
jgi:hypothetical protein